MKKVALLVISLIFTISMFPQTKAVLTAKVKTLEFKIDSLNAEIQLLKQQNRYLVDGIASIKSIVVDSCDKLLTTPLPEIQLNTNSQAIKSQSNAVIDPAEGGTKRCKAITQAGTQCKRNAEPGSDYCWQHKSAGTVNKSSNTVDNPTNYGSSSSGRTILTGPRGGKYYINSKGNKTYIKK